MEITHENIEIAVQMQRWEGVAETVMDGKLSLDGCVNEHAYRLKLQVAEGKVSVDELRAGVAFANVLDKESAQQHGADLRTGAECISRTAVRIMHQAGRTALKDLNREKQRQTNGNNARNTRLHSRRSPYGAYRDRRV